MRKFDRAVSISCSLLYRTYSSIYVGLILCIVGVFCSPYLSWGLVTNINVQPVTSDELVDPGDLQAVVASIAITDSGIFGKKPATLSPFKIPIFRMAEAK